MKRSTMLTPVLACLAAGMPAFADDVSNADRILCSAAIVTACFEDGECIEATPEDLNMPQFIEIDLTTKKLSTTKASGLNRTSTADSVRRADGTIVVQGFENRRAYSFVIEAKTGTVVVAVAGELGGMTAFGSCTPLPASK